VLLGDIITGNAGLPNDVAGVGDVQEYGGAGNRLFVHVDSSNRNIMAATAATEPRYANTTGVALIYPDQSISYAALLLLLLICIPL